MMTILNVGPNIHKVGVTDINCTTFTFSLQIGMFGVMLLYKSLHGLAPSYWQHIAI